jgi:putative flippase GtrA
VTQNGVNLALFAFALAMGAGYVAAACLGSVCGLAVSYVLNRLWTFSAGERAKLHHELGRYVLVFASAVLLGIAVLAILVEGVSLPEVAAQAIAIVTVAPLSFYVQRTWVFRAAAQR